MAVKDIVQENSYTEMPTEGKFGDVQTDGSAVAAKYADRITGKTIIVTGVSPGGLGAETALTFAAHDPKLLILANRSAAKTAETEAIIKAKYPSANTRFLELDLQSFKSAEAAATKVNNWADVEAIDIIVNNAAIMAGNYHKTGDGLESQIQTNHLSPFLFTNLIMPKILKSKQPRVVNVSSGGHRFSDVAPAYWDVNCADGMSYNKWVGYGRGKTANILFAVELAKKYGSRGLVAMAPHPGVIKTNLARSFEPGELDELVAKSPHLQYKTMQQGISTAMVAALHPDMERYNGSYMVDCCPVQPVHPYANDRENAEKLWKWSEKIVGKTFEN